MATNRDRQELTGESGLILGGAPLILLCILPLLMMPLALRPFIANVFPVYTIQYGL